MSSSACCGVVFQARPRTGISYRLIRRAVAYLHGCEIVGSTERCPRQEHVSHASSACMAGQPLLGSTWSRSSALARSNPQPADAEARGFPEHAFSRQDSRDTGWDRWYCSQFSNFWWYRTVGPVGPPWKIADPTSVVVRRAHLDVKTTGISMDYSIRPASSRPRHCRILDRRDNGATAARPRCRQATGLWFHGDGG
jgi:hypothetical protein